MLPFLTTLRKIEDGNFEEDYDLILFLLWLRISTFLPIHPHLLLITTTWFLFCLRRQEYLCSSWFPNTLIEILSSFLNLLLLQHNILCNNSVGYFRVKRRYFSIIFLSESKLFSTFSSGFLFTCRFHSLLPSKPPDTLSRLLQKAIIMTREGSHSIGFLIKSVIKPSQLIGAWRELYIFWSITWGINKILWSV